MDIFQARTGMEIVSNVIKLMDETRRESEAKEKAEAKAEDLRKENNELAAEIAQVNKQLESVRRENAHLAEVVQKSGEARSRLEAIGNEYRQCRDWLASQGHTEEGQTMTLLDVWNYIVEKDSQHEKGNGKGS